MNSRAQRTALRAGVTASAALAVVLGVGVPPASADNGTEMGSINHGRPLADAAAELIDNLNQIGWPQESDYNFYSAPSAATTVVFGTPGQPTTYRNETRCATFVRRLLTHTFPWATSTFFNDEFGTSYPNSAVFHDAFAADRDRTDDIPGVRAFNLSFLSYMTLQPGDIMAIKYTGASTSESGHMAIIGPGTRLHDDSHPDYREWAISLLDSTSSPHGNPANPRGYPDSRFYYDADTQTWTEADGAGSGWMFIRTSRATGRITEHRWSLSSNTWYDTTARPIVVARVDPYA
ncbi:hypothetical protein ACTMSW_25900 [Micromonospora sp. BQ11]|uniref:hypothetical protein n=1 Tax=Micromonospora sp. BQ11 TaxID=3452212 RepID=UPI003F8B7ADA